MPRVFYQTDVPPDALAGETVAVLGYGIQGRAQALNLRDSGVEVVVGNRRDPYRQRAESDGFTVLDLDEAAERGNVLVLLLPDEVQPPIYNDVLAPRLKPGDALVFAHGFAVHYGLIRPPDDVDRLLLAPRMPGMYLRQRFLEGWGVPAFVGVGHDATGRAQARLLGLAGALGVTRCAAIETTFAEETELDHFSEHVTYPAILHLLELAFEVLVDAGYPPEVALMELHGSGELGEVLSAAAREGLQGMLRSHASPACQVGIATHWDAALGSVAKARQRMRAQIETIRNGSFARLLVEEQEAGYPRLTRWHEGRPRTLGEVERRLRSWLKEPPAGNG